MNELEIRKKELLINIKMILSIIIFIFCVLIIVFHSYLYMSYKHLSNEASISSMYTEMIGNLQHERKINKNLVDINKDIEQLNNISKESRAISLLVLIGKTSNRLFLLQNAEEKNDYYIELYKKILSQLVISYKKLKEEGSFESVINNRIVINLYLLNNEIENLKEIKKIQAKGFKTYLFVENNDDYWKNNFAKEFGDDIPVYLNRLMLQNYDDRSKAKKWINNYK